MTRAAVEAFSRRLRHEVNLDALSSDLVDVVRQTVQPAGVILWLLPRAAAGARSEAVESAAVV